MMRITVLGWVIFLFSCKGDQLTDIDLIERMEKNDRQLPVAQQGDWRYEHKEAVQSFADYQQSSPVRPDSTHNKIYLLPIGSFSKEQEKVIGYTGDYLQVYFGLQAKMLSPVSDDLIPDSAKRKRENGSVQLLAPYILDSILKKRIPADAIVLMAVTEKDLYPKPQWNYVFGQASLKERVGVSSIYRYSTKPVDSVNYSICLRRLINTSSHEIGHMFSMHHCLNAVCVMNGSNSLAESDTKPNRLCSECLKKLWWDIGLDTRKRLRSLDSFFVKHHLRQDYQLSRLDIGVLERE